MNLIILSDNNNILSSASGEVCGAVFLCIYGNAPKHCTKDDKKFVITTPPDNVPVRLPLRRSHETEFQVPEKASKL